MEYQQHGLALCNSTTNEPGRDFICPACEGWFRLCCDWLERPVVFYEPKDD